MIVWLTGQPGTGKSTLADHLLRNGSVDFIVDGDDLREIMPNPGYGQEGRRQNIDRAQTIAAFLDDRGFDVAVALVAPYRDQRETFKQSHDVKEVYLWYDPQDTTRGREHYWVEDYEPPERCHLKIDTGSATELEAVSGIVSVL